MSLGEDYDERVLPSITSEVLKAIVVSILKHVFCSVVLVLYPNVNSLYLNLLICEARLAMLMDIPQ